MPFAPGVYLEELPLARPSPELRTGVPVFLCAGGILDTTPIAGTKGEASLSTAAEAVIARLDPYTRWAVRGFFANGGRRCYVVPGSILTSDAALARADRLDDIDLVCAPSLAEEGAVALARAGARILSFCAARGGLFAILDPVRKKHEIRPYLEALLAEAKSADRALGALYFPWIQVADACPVCLGTGIAAGLTCLSCRMTGAGLVPPSGHVAGIYARTDREKGVWAAPANAVVEGALDLGASITRAEQGDLNAEGVNCLSTLRGRGIQVFGARTLSGEAPTRYVNVQRLMLTLGRWLERAMAGLVFETNEPTLWIRVTREVTAMLDGLYQRGALAGNAPEEAYWVKCDEETNPPESRARGALVTEIGIAPARPGEFIVVRLLQTEGRSDTKVTTGTGQRT